MAHVLKTPNHYTLENARLGSLIEEVAQRIQRREIETEEELLSALFRAYRRAHLSMTTPIFDAKALNALDIRTPELFNKPLKEIEHDLKMLVNAAPLLTSALQEGFNYLQALEEMTRESLKVGATRSVDLKILSGSLRRDVIVAGDDFQDSSKIDRQKTSPSRHIEVSPFGGFITLKRVGTVDITEKVTPTVLVSGPPGLYEGRLYGEPTNVEPEGEAFEFSRTAGTFSEHRAGGLDPALRSRFESLNAILRSSPARQQELGLQGELTPDVGRARAVATGSYAGFTTDDWEQLAGNFHYERNFAAVAPTTPFDVKKDVEDSDFQVSLVTASEESKRGKRLRIFDKNPDTFWQAELVYDTDPEFNRVALFEDEQSVKAIPERSLEEIRNAVQTSYDPEDLEVTLTIDLTEPQILNTLTLHPYVADANCVPEVVSISTSVDGTSFEDIPEIQDGRFERHLTSDVNKELTREETVLSLAADKGQYQGQGLFSFSPREVRFVRVRLRENVPVVTPYSIVRVHLSKTVTVSTKEQRGWGRKDKRRSYTEHYSKHVDLDYPQSLLLLSAQSDDEHLSTPGTSITFRRGDSFIPSQSAIRYTALGSIVAVIADALTRGRRRTRVEDTGWQIDELSDPPITRYDKARYVIGIRELGLFKYTYAPEGEVVSVPFRSPKPISAVSLQVDDSIPTRLNVDGASTDLIEYYFSLDDGKTWNRISPLGAAPRREEGVFIPQIFHINSDVSLDRRDPNLGYIDLSGQNAYEVRFRALLKGSQEESGLTPVLKGYRLLLEAGGLRA